MKHLPLKNMTDDELLAEWRLANKRYACDNDRSMWPRLREIETEVWRREGK